MKIEKEERDKIILLLRFFMILAMILGGISGYILHEYTVMKDCSQICHDYIMTQQCTCFKREIDIPSLIATP